MTPSTTDSPRSTRVESIARAGELAGGRTASAGEVAWIAVDAAAQRLQVRALEPTRLVAYAGPVIDEPSVAHGPFVMTTMEEIRQARVDLNAGRFLSASAVLPARPGHLSRPGAPSASRAAPP